MPEMRVVYEVAVYLRAKERKIYDLIAQKQVPWVQENDYFSSRGICVVDRPVRTEMDVGLTIT